MKSPQEKRLTAWGRSSVTTSRTWRIGDEQDAVRAIQSGAPHGVIARGFGRSYGDVCLNDNGDVLDLTGFGKIRLFDQTAGTLECDAGTSYESIMRHCVGKGWHPAICPGTAVVSMGGAVANDVHGKNQHIAGNFGDHVEWLDLLLPDGNVRRITPASDTDLFYATVGGLGLTGVIMALKIRLTATPSNAMDLEEIRIPDLDSFLDRLRSSEKDFPYAVGWIDAATTGRKMGRGILELARPSDKGVREPAGITLNVPFEFPTWVLNRHTVNAFNNVYFHRLPARGRSRRIHINRFLFPLDAIHNWNRMYGRRGVYQFQCVVPFGDGRRAIVELMEEIVRSRGASFLAVLKSMGRHGQGMLSFPMPGFTLALDFPRRAATRALVERLHDITLKFGGRVYLAKDACLTPERLQAMYPELSRFKAVLRSIDPNGVMQSDMSRRLELNAR